MSRHRENDCSRRKGGQPAKPIRPAIDHDPSLFVHNQQCTVPVVAARAYFDLAARAEERKFKHIVFATDCRQTAFCLRTRRRPSNIGQIGDQDRGEIFYKSPPSVKYSTGALRPLSVEG